MKQPLDRKKTISTFVFVLFVLALGVVLWYAYHQGLIHMFDDGNEEYLSKAAIGTNANDCTDLAQRILKMNGSAVDAAITASFCLGLVVPQACGIGGGFLATIYIRNRKKIETLNAREVAPLNASQSLYEGNSSLSKEGGLSIAVPTEVKGLWDLHQKYGRLPWKSLLNPVIQLAQKGFSVPSYLADVLQAREEKIRNTKVFRDVFINPSTNSVYREGEKLKNYRLADTLKIIAKEGADAIYSPGGSLAQKIVNEIKENGGLVTMDDLTNYNPKWSGSVSKKLFNGDTLHTMPIPSSACVIPFILNILEGYKFYTNSFAYHNENKLIFHRIVEAFKFAFGMRTKLGDIKNTKVIETVRKLQNVDFASHIITLINDERTFNDTNYYGAEGSVDVDYGTSHLSILASNGDAISLTTTINSIFGSWIMSESTGVIYNNEMDDFSIPSASNGLLRSEANSIQPAKSPLSSMSPIIMLNEKNEVTMVLGGAGGMLIMTSLVLFMVNFLYLNQTIDASMGMKRFHHQLEPMYVRFEDGYDRPDIITYLRDKGHGISTSATILSAFASIVAISNRDGKVETSIDPRRGGEGVVFDPL